jgi:hypothetical protein
MHIYIYRERENEREREKTYYHTFYFSGTYHYFHNYMCVCMNVCMFFFFCGCGIPFFIYECVWFRMNSSQNIANTTFGNQTTDPSSKNRQPSSHRKILTMPNHEKHIQ